CSTIVCARARRSRTPCCWLRSSASTLTSSAAIPHPPRWTMPYASLLVILARSSRVDTTSHSSPALRSMSQRCCATPIRSGIS
ncbi:MAG: hypothetical protein AVDCRST_MAG26-1912, partial [uncultured Chloroflexia bacterium]